MTCGYFSPNVILEIIQLTGTPWLFGVQRTSKLLIAHSICIIICLTKNDGIMGCQTHLRTKQLFLLVQRRSPLKQCNMVQRGNKTLKATWLVGTFQQ